MVENYFVIQRRANKNGLALFLREHRDLGIEKCLGQYSSKTGLRVSLLRVYLEEMKMAGEVE